MCYSLWYNAPTMLPASDNIVDTIKVYLKEMGWEFVDGLIWFRTGTGGGFL